MGIALTNALIQGVYKALAQPVARTANLTGSAFDAKDYEGLAVVHQGVGAVSGTNPTWDGKIQDSADGSTGWADVSGAAFTQVTAADNDQQVVVDLKATKRYLRYVGTIGGTSTPTFGLSVTFAGIKKYRS